MSTSNRIRAGLVVGACLAVLSGCAGDSASTTADAADSTAATPSAKAAREPVRKAAPADLANFACAPRGRKLRWEARGDLTNDADAPMVYTITVVTVGAADEVLGERAGSFTLQPGQTRTFTWPRFYRGPAEACLPRVLRRPT